MGSKKLIEAPEGTYYKLRTDQLTLITDPKDPLFDPSRIDEPVDQNYVNVVKAKGVDKPIFFKKRIVEQENPKTKKMEKVEQFVIVDGRQRYKTVVEGNKQLVAEGIKDRPILIPAIHKLDDDQGSVGLMLRANVNGIPERPIGLTKKIKTAMDLGTSVETLAADLGWNVATVKRRLKLLHLCPEVAKACDSYEITMDAAFAMVDLPESKQLSLLTEMREAAKQAANATPAVPAADGAPATPPPTPVVNSKDLKQKAREAAGLKLNTAPSKTTQKRVQTAFEKYLANNPHSSDLAKGILQGFNYLLDGITSDEISKILRVINGQTAAPQQSAASAQTPATPPAAAPKSAEAKVNAIVNGQATPPPAPAALSEAAEELEF